MKSKFIAFLQSLALLNDYVFFKDLPTFFLDSIKIVFSGQWYFSLWFLISCVFFNTPFSIFKMIHTPIWVFIQTSLFKHDFYFKYDEEHFFKSIDTVGLVYKGVVNLILMLCLECNLLTICCCSVSLACWCFNGWFLVSLIFFYTVRSNKALFFSEQKYFTSQKEWVISNDDLKFN